ncbi:MAG: tyrosine-type recombinase/integrase [archaeon]
MTRRLTPSGLRTNSEDLYNSTKGLKRALEKLQNDTNIIPQNKQDITDFIYGMTALGIKPIRLKKEIYVLRKISQFLGHIFREAEKKEMLILFSKIELSDYSDWSKTEFKVILKRFYKWLLGEDQYYPVCVAWIRTKDVKNHILPEQLLTEEEITSVINACQFVRDKAFIHLLYESGARIGEILSLKIKHITFAEPVSAILVNGKTGQRRIPIIKSVAPLKEWILKHPFKDNPESQLWVKTNERKGNFRKQGEHSNTDHIGYSSVNKLLQVNFELVGLKKRCNPHIFRHSRAAFLAKHLTEAQLKMFFGWTQNSDMAARYVHLSGRDLDSVIFGLSKAI